MLRRVILFNEVQFFYFDVAYFLHREFNISLEQIAISSNDLFARQIFDFAFIVFWTFQKTPRIPLWYTLVYHKSRSIERFCTTRYYCCSQIFPVNTYTNKENDRVVCNFR